MLQSTFNNNRNNNGTSYNYYIVCLCTNSININKDGCPSGYEARNGDIPGWGTILGSKLSLTKEECAQSCNQKDSCRSFEHSDSMKLCNLNKIGEPKLGPYKDFAFCKKKGMAFAVILI